MKMNTLLPSFMLFACTFQTIALNSETQNTIIKLEQSVISVGQLITQIENQTDYLVVFKSREVRHRTLHYCPKHIRENDILS